MNNVVKSFVIQKERKQLSLDQLQLEIQQKQLKADTKQLDSKQTEIILLLESVERVQSAVVRSEQHIIKLVAALDIKENALKTKEKELEEREKKLQKTEQFVTAKVHTFRPKPSTAHSRSSVANAPQFRRLFTCTMLNCGLNFKSFHDLRRHLDKHVGKKYSCQLCGREFSRPENRDRHVKTVHFFKET